MKKLGVIAFQITFDDDNKAMQQVSYDVVHFVLVQCTDENHWKVISYVKLMQAII